MNKYQKEIVKFAKKMMSATMDNAPLAQFRIARRYSRGTISYTDCTSKRDLNRKSKILMDWYLKVLQNWKW